MAPEMAGEPKWRDIFCLAKYTSSGACAIDASRERSKGGRDAAAGGGKEEKKMTINIEERDINIRRGLPSLPSLSCWKWDQLSPLPENA